MRRRRYREILSLLCIVAAVVGAVYYREIQAERELEADSAAISNEQIYPGGMPAGIYLETDGVMVLGTKELEAVDGKTYHPGKGLLQEGDYIVEMNHQRIATKQELIRAVSQWTGGNIALRIRRNEALVDVRLQPVETVRGHYMLGVWVRDNTQGLGTVTYVTADGAFGSLGHGLRDADTGNLLEVAEGHLYRTGIRSIQKGVKGTPGGMEGIIIYNTYNIMGDIKENTEVGIYGSVSDPKALLSEVSPMYTASSEEVKTGDAVIRCGVEGVVKEYGIRITKIDKMYAEPSKAITIEITDERLLSLTGGIIQGMSGSPIIQNEKIVGAVTHVFVNDPTKGYGIFIENMLNR